jgi:hypothetical protein
VNKLFLQQRYLDFPPRDVSGNGNDGTAFSVTQGTGINWHAAEFDGQASWIQVPKSPSMDDLVQFRAQVTFRLDPSAPARRMNLVEGFVSFAIFVADDRSLQFSIVDGEGNWNVCSSQGGVVALDTWQTLVAAHDGVSEARIALGPDLVARKTGIRGPIRSVGPLGVAIGRWPDAPAYQLHGQLSEVALYKFDPEPELYTVFGAPCVDGDAVERWFTELAARLGGENEMQAWAARAQRLLVAAGDAITRGSQDTDEYRARMAAVAAALGMRDREAFATHFGALSEQVDGRLSDEDRERVSAEFQEVRGALPFDDDELRELAVALCLDRLSTRR